MNCPNCNAALEQDEKFCPFCGHSVSQPAQNFEATEPEPGIAPVSEPAPQPPVSEPAPQPPVAPAAPAAPVQPPYAYQQPPVYAPPVAQDYAPQYKPLSPWAYVGYNILFAIPLVGFILLIVFCFNDSNINRRNYARSFFCAMLIGILLLIVGLILTAVFGVSLMEYVRDAAGAYM